MEPTTLGMRVAAGAVTPLVRKLLVRRGPGAGLVDQPVRIGGWLSFRGEKRTLDPGDLARLAEEVVARYAKAAGPHDAPAPEVRREVADALAHALGRLGELDMDDVQAVRLGPGELAARVGRPEHLSAGADALFGPLLHTVCLHVLNFFTQNSTFVARTAVEQSARLDRIASTLELLAERVPDRTAADARFEEEYAAHVARRHSELTIYGLDLHHTREWPLDTAYISLEAEAGGAPLPAERALHGTERVLLRGAAGSGKTTLLQWLAVTTARQDGERLARLPHLVGRVPFVLPLRRVLRDGQPPTPDHFLHAAGSSLAGEQPDGWAVGVLRAGRGLLLVDGIDEIPETERGATRRWLRELLADFPGNLWLVTSRPSAVENDWLARDGFAELALSPMGRADVAAFVQRWHEAAEAPPELADALLGLVRTTSDLARLASNPLMCGLLCALHRERHGFLPHSRKDLYEAALSMLLERRDVERAIRDDALRLSKDSSVVLLQKLAHWMLRNGRAEMDRADVVAQLERTLPQMAHITATPEGVYRHLRDRSGLLREPAADRVDFVHRTFQDYLAAKAAVEEGDFPLLLDNADKTQWEDVLRMAVAHARPAERARLLRGLLSGPPDSEYAEDHHYRELLAATCLQEATELDPAVREEVERRLRSLVPPRDLAFAHWLADGVGSPLVLGLLPGPEGLDDETALNVVITASSFTEDAALPVLARYRSHPSLGVRRQLAWAWHRYDTRQYAREVIAHLAEDELYFTVASVEHLKALRDLGGRSRVHAAYVHEPEDLVAHVPAERLTHLWLSTGWSAGLDMSWLGAFPRLRTLVVPEWPPEVVERTLPSALKVKVSRNVVSP
ncbi:NACHT domain-containing protein [Streptomyces sp. WMMC1477]|uniref:NACHT domain-containing protein n=1 Tax=Streptomyces sp. WMMC1477 TaxID=3015155 RepID=UPI0022B70401|nr:NACHT domain-containing protein [Streptomyces sp. WMMC1477]MCZ7431996.1 NACHT domain-containing protein [Streptomyces sp. WMMC1477]